MVTPFQIEYAAIFLQTPQIFWDILSEIADLISCRWYKRLYSCKKMYIKKSQDVQYTMLYFYYIDKSEGVSKKKILFQNRIQD